MHSFEAVDFIIILWISLFFLSLTQITVAYTDCKSLCDDKWSDKVEYENCLRQCSSFRKSPGSSVTVNKKIKTYPKPPTNVRVHWSLKILHNVKYITAKVTWENDADEVDRTGYYLSFLAIGNECENKFPGFHTLNIPSTARSFEIPYQTSSFQQLILDFNCAYKLEIKSIPYPYGNPSYVSLMSLTTPNCIDGYCSCKGQQKPNEPEIVGISVFDNSTKVKISWQFVPSKDRIDIEKIEFLVKLAELLRKPNVAVLPWKKVFKWTSFEDRISASEDQIIYSTIIPDLIEGNEYKIQIIAYNQDLCKSKEIEHKFIAQNTADYSNSDSFVDFITTLTDNVTSVNNSEELFPVTESVALLDFITTDYVSSDNESSEVGHRTISTHSISALPQNEDYLAVCLPLIGILCAIITGFSIWKIYNMRKAKWLKNKQFLQQLNHWSLSSGHSNSTVETNILYTEKKIVEARAYGLADEFEISHERLSLGRVIGQGAFGLVYTGRAESIRGMSGTNRVAIKQLKANADEREYKEFLAEIAMMKRIEPHPNVVTMYGCCTLVYPYCMVMEYVPYGDLLNYLHNLRKILENEIEEYRISLERDYIMQLGNTHPLMTRVEINESSLGTDFPINDKHTTLRDTCCDHIPFVDSDVGVCSTSTSLGSLNTAELQSFAYQVASGMAHLERLRVTHRDLACRNVLVGHGKVLKISDFGLSRIGIYVKTTSGRIPLRWLSLEAMRDHAYSTKSDVWAYGVVLWEICTLGGFPYPTIPDKDILNYLELGNRLPKPAACSDEIFQLMTECWSCNPAHRPSFNVIKQKLKALDNDGHAYVEFAAQDDVTLPSKEYCKIVPLAKSEDLEFDSFVV